MEAVTVIEVFNHQHKLEKVASLNSPELSRCCSPAPMDPVGSVSRGIAAVVSAG